VTTVLVAARPDRHLLDPQLVAYLTAMGVEEISETSGFDVCVVVSQPSELRFRAAAARSSTIPTACSINRPAMSTVSISVQPVCS
jgi:hypothetical protein